jgi:hypothetical protein
LGVATVGVNVISHYYSERKDELAEADRRSAATIVSGKLEEARERASNAEHKAAKLEGQLAQRTLSPIQREIITDAIAPFAGAKILILAPMGDAEADTFADEFVTIFKGQGWLVESGGVMQAPIMSSPSSPDVEVAVNEADNIAHRLPPGAGPLIDAIVACNLAPMGYKSDHLTSGQVSITIGHKPQRDAP